MIGKVGEAQIFENAVINQLSGFGKVSFLNIRNTAEIDAILDKDMSFEIKLTGTQQDLLKLSELSSELEISQSFLISKRFQNRQGFLSPVIF